MRYVCSPLRNVYSPLRNVRSPLRNIDQTPYWDKFNPPILILSFLLSYSDYFVRPLYAYSPLYTMYLVNFTATTATNVSNTLWYNILSGGRRGGRRVILVAVKAFLGKNHAFFESFHSFFYHFTLHFYVKIMLIQLKMPRRITAAGQRVLLLYED